MSASSSATSSAQVEVSKACARKTLGERLPQAFFTAMGSYINYAKESDNGERYQLSLTQGIFNKAKFSKKSIGR
ncbi:hypothetical protein [Marinomonas sp. 2405UD68-3]|uniref:hypothetical protein n=1 Tax=Marinomonas sp. 2405UD68-3 TaxID=3391835 RepID=UPI0039C8E7C2